MHFLLCLYVVAIVEPNNSEPNELKPDVSPACPLTLATHSCPLARSLLQVPLAKCACPLPVLA